MKFYTIMSNDFPIGIGTSREVDALILELKARDADRGLPVHRMHYRVYGFEIRLRDLVLDRLREMIAGCWVRLKIGLGLGRR